MDIKKLILFISLVTSCKTYLQDFNVPKPSKLNLNLFGFYFLFYFLDPYQTFIKLNRIIFKKNFMNKLLKF